jgi:type II secretion system protein N
MVEQKRRLGLRIAGYAAFAMVSLVLAFFVTFPYEALKDRARLEADAAGYFVRIGSLGPGFFAITATDVQVSKKADTDPPPEPLKLDRVSIGPAFFPPGVQVKVKGLGGTTSIVIAGLSTVKVKVDLDELDLSKGNVKGFTGIDFAGTLDAHVELSVPRVPGAGNGPAEPDLSQATGTITVDTKGLTVNGGNVSVVIPQFGADPTPLDLPKIALGEITVRLKVDKGAGTVDDFKAKSSDLEAGLSGTLKLGKKVEYSDANLEVRIKPEAEFQKRLGLLGSALSMIPADPKDPTWRLGHLTGYLGKPQFR